MYNPKIFFDNRHFVCVQECTLEDFYNEEVGQMVWFGWAIPSFNMYSNAYDLSLTYTDEIFTKVCFRLGVGIIYSCHQKRVIRQTSHLTRA